MLKFRGLALGAKAAIATGVLASTMAITSGIVLAKHGSPSGGSPSTTASPKPTKSSQSHKATHTPNPHSSYGHCVSNNAHNKKRPHGRAGNPTQGCTKPNGKSKPSPSPSGSGSPSPSDSTSPTSTPSATATPTETSAVTPSGSPTGTPS